MKKPHVHAAVIHAFADGAKIQYRRRTDGEWVDIINPSFHSDREYRIKPAKNQALVDAFDAGKIIQARRKGSGANWYDQGNTGLRTALAEGLLDGTYDLRVKPAFPELYDAYMAGKTIQAKFSDRPDKWDDQMRCELLKQVLLGDREHRSNIDYRIKPDTCVQHSRRYVYRNFSGKEAVGLAYKTDPTDERFVRWLDDDWLATELET
jgi:hypothetical protein